MLQGELLICVLEPESESNTLSTYTFLPHTYCMSHCLRQPGYMSSVSLSLSLCLSLDKLQEVLEKLKGLYQELNMHKQLWNVSIYIYILSSTLHTFDITDLGGSY